jgi:hypothetical protein
MRMEMTYDNIMQWMKEYFEVYSTYGQKPESARRMHDYFAPDLKFIPYIAPIGGPAGGFKSRDEFLHVAVSHPSWYEKLLPVDISIDERKKTVVVLFNMEVVDTKKNQAVITRSAMARYQLALDENETIKIKSIHFFWEVLPPGSPEFFDLFGWE